VNREEGRSLSSRPVLKRLYKREADGQEMADIDMSGIIQVLSPGDVAFTLGAGNDSYIVSNSAEWDPNNICMSLTSLIGGLVMLLGVLVVASFVASFMHCQMRKKKTKKVPQ
jgi:Na+/proline symporter